MPPGRPAPAMCLSTIATATPAAVAAAAPDTERWLQLYCFSDRAVTEAIIAEAVQSGFKAIALTVDAPRAGRRERDLRTGVKTEHAAPGRAGRRRLGPPADPQGGVRPGRPLARLGQPRRPRGRLRAADPAEGPDVARRRGARDRGGRGGRDRLQPRWPPARRGAGDDRRARRRRRGGRGPCARADGRRRAARGRRAHRPGPGRRARCSWVARPCGGWRPEARTAPATCWSCCATRSPSPSPCWAAGRRPR